MMRDFDQLLEEDIGAYAGPQAGLIRQAPELYRLMIRLLEDPNLPGRLRPMVIAAIAYFILPADIMPEDLKGPQGYADDIFLCAFVAGRVRRILGTDEILTGNWEGEIPVLQLVEDILSKEEALIMDKRELILWYIGYEYLPGD